MKAISNGAVMAHSSTIQRSTPLLEIAEINSTPARLCDGRTTGVRPLGFCCKELGRTAMG